MSLKNLEKSLLKNNRHVREGTRNANAIAKAGTLLRRLREWRKMTQREVEAASGVQQAEISRIEGGRATRGLTISQLQTLAHAQDAEIVIAIVQKGSVSAKDSVEIKGQPVILHTVI